MEELGVQPNTEIVTMIGNVFQELGMFDKYEKLKKKYPPLKWEYRYVKGKRVRIRAKYLNEYGNSNNGSSELDQKDDSSIKLLEEAETVSKDSSLEDEEMREDPDEILEDESKLEAPDFEYNFMGYGRL